jgi:hypothetical protein
MHIIMKALFPLSSPAAQDRRSTKSFRRLQMLRNAVIITVMSVVCFSFGTALFAAIPADYKGIPFTGNPLKGKPQHIPGTIVSVYFDVGGEGVAFHEQDNVAEGSESRMRFDSTGKELKEDYAVDVQQFHQPQYPDHDMISPQKPSDPCISDTMKGYHIGWCQVKVANDPQYQEWLKYTVHVDTAGIYTMDVHWSIDRDNDIFGLTWSGLKTDSIKNPKMSVCCGNCDPNTSAYHELCHMWKWDNDILSVTIPDTGLYVFKLQFLQGNCNIDRMVFRLKTVGTIRPDAKSSITTSGLSVKSMLKGNDVAVSYSLNQAGPVTVSVFDCAGRSAAPAIIRNMTAGPHAQEIKLSDLAAGVHFVRVEHNGITETRSFTIAR